MSDSSLVSVSAVEPPIIDQSTDQSSPQIPDRRALRASKLARKQHEAALRRKAKAISNNISNESALKALQDGTKEGNGLAKYGNFHSYYQFNQVDERIQYLPANIVHDLSRAINQSIDQSISQLSLQSNPEKQTVDQSTDTAKFHIPRISFPINQSINRSLIMLDVGCNEGDLTEGLLSSMAKQSIDASTGQSSTFMYAIGCDIDKELIKRAQTKYQSTSQSINQSSYFHADLTDFAVLDSLIDALPSCDTYGDRKYDLISCHAVLMWIHLNHGTDRLVDWLTKLSSMTRNLIIEFQPYRHYKSAISRLKKSSIDVDQVWHWSSITDQWKGEGNVRKQVTIVLEKCGMIEKQQLGVTTWDRPIVWFTRQNT